MCLAAFAINMSARWPLVIASNRDEYFDRAALPLARWQTAGGTAVVSGRDMLAGGSWFGMTPAGRVALLTNVRQPADAVLPVNVQSRGALVLRWLEARMDASEFMAQAAGASYGGFNLVVGDWRTSHWTWLSNRRFDRDGRVFFEQGPTPWMSRVLTPGIYGLSNAALDTPWPKTVALTKQLQTALVRAEAEGASDVMEAALWDALSDRKRARLEDLPHTGVTPALEEALSSAFVDVPERSYGTRCSTLLFASSHKSSADTEAWKVDIEEKTFVRTAPDHALASASAATVQETVFWKKNEPEPVF